MIFRFVFFVGCLFLELHATKEANSTLKLELYTQTLQASASEINASGDSVVYYNKMMMYANKVRYEKEKHLLHLEENVTILGYKGMKEQASQVIIDTEDQSSELTNLFLMTKDDIWIATDKATRSEGNYTLGTTVISSCAVKDPLWKIVFSDSIFDTNSSYMTLYHSKVYFMDIPIFYFPYLSFSTNTKRTSGLLFPAFGYRSDEGLLFEQPIFWAISKSMDLEFNPQIRSNRSVGMYSTLRFVDSAYSSGALRLGYFKDNADYVQEYALNNDQHYGLEFNYNSSKVFSEFFNNEVTDGLYINSTFFNDIEYLTLQTQTLEHFGLTQLQESRLNYFMYTNDYYAGMNAKYFIDTQKQSNADTLQILPSVQLHKYLTHFIWDNLTYSVNMNMHHFDRQEGTTLKQVEGTIPLEFTTSFLDNFLNLSLGETFYYSKFFFGNESYTYPQFEYYSNIHKMVLFSDLTKSYDDFTHVLQPHVTYIKPGDERAKPIEFKNLESGQKELFAVGLPEEQYQIGMGQYFYTEEMKLRFFQKFSQVYYPNRAYKWADFRNEMAYSEEYWRLYNSFTYSYAFGKLRESSSSFSLNTSKYSLSLGHSYKQKLADDIASFTPTNDINLYFTYQWDEKWHFNGGINYDLDEASNTQWYVGLKYTQDCWSASLSLKEQIEPFASANQSSRKNRDFYFQLNFIPFGSIGSGK